MQPKRNAEDGDGGDPESSGFSGSVQLERRVCGGDVGDRVSSVLGVQKYRNIGLSDLKI